MLPRVLQSNIHYNTVPTSGQLSAWRTEITGLYATGGYDTTEFSDHLIREYNRRSIVGGFTGLTIGPYDDGYRYIGTGNFT
jgi:hypothetical protein